MAAIVGDPACKRESELATLTNWTSTKWLVDRCAEVGIQRFVFASTCSNYGKMADRSAYLTEESELAPVSLYAELKVKFEVHSQRDSKTERFLPRFFTFLYRLWFVTKNEI